MRSKNNMQFDNIATPGAPVWRGRRCVPLTCHEVRMELAAQAAELPEHERVRYLNERLTGLDKALTDNEALAIEWWLDCEEMLRGRAASSEFNGSSRAQASRGMTLPDDCMEMLKQHAAVKKRLASHHLRALAALGSMMEGRDWLVTSRFIFEVRSAARALGRIHAGLENALDRAG